MVAPKLLSILGIQCSKGDNLTYNWNKEKNIKLKKERGISFEEIVHFISHGYLLDIIENPNNEEYSNQLIFVINIDNYAYLVPFVENDTEIFLKTIYPSRKATKIYLEKD